MLCTITFLGEFIFVTEGSLYLEEVIMYNVNTHCTFIIVDVTAGYTEIHGGDSVFIKVCFDAKIRAS